MLWKIWNDSVWSKVIGAGITAALAGAGAVALKHLGALSEAALRVADLLGSPLTVPMWLVLVTILLVTTLLTAALLLTLRRRVPTRGGDDVPEPNAVLVALVPPERR